MSAANIKKLHFRQSAHHRNNASVKICHMYQVKDYEGGTTAIKDINLLLYIKLFCVLVDKQKQSSLSKQNHTKQSSLSKQNHTKQSSLSKQNHTKQLIPIILKLQNSR